MDLQLPQECTDECVDLCVHASRLPDLWVELLAPRVLIPEQRRG